MEILKEPIFWIALIIALPLSYLRYKQVDRQLKTSPGANNSAVWTLLFLVIGVMIFSQVVFGCVGWRTYCVNVFNAPLITKLIVGGLAAILIIYYVWSRSRSSK